MKYREITAADVPALFHVRTRTRENTMTLEALHRLGIDPQSVTESLRMTAKGWVCASAGQVVAFSMADRATGELLVIAVLPEFEGKGVGGRLMGLAEEWLAASGCRRAWLTTDLDTKLRAYGFYRKRGWTDWKIERGMRWMELGLPRLDSLEEKHMVKGECNCGAVRFEIDANLSGIYVCHCSICRRSTGSNGIAVALVPNEKFRWVLGREHIATWKKPQGDWQTWFCRECGSPVPGENDPATMFVPAGAITHGGEALKVIHHIWVGSRAVWDEIGDAGKQHAEAFRG